MAALDQARQEIWYEFDHATGPGGQHVNKTSTRVTVCFNLQNSSALSAEEKALLAVKLRNRINSEGILKVTAGTERSQLLNRQVALELFSQLIVNALKVPKKRIATQPTFASKVRRRNDKEHQSRRKQNRRFKGDEGHY